MVKTNNFHVATEHQGLKEEVWQTKVREAVYHKLLLHNHHTKHAKFETCKIPTEHNHMRGLSHRLSSRSCDCRSKLWPALLVLDCLLHFSGFDCWLCSISAWTMVFQHGLWAYFALWPNKNTYGDSTPSLLCGVKMHGRSCDCGACWSDRPWQERIMT